MRTNSATDNPILPAAGMTPKMLRARGRLAFTCCFALLLYAVYLGALSVLIPAIGHSFHLGEEIQGRLFPATFSGFVLAVLVCGYLSDQLGRKWVLLAGLAVYSFGLTIFALSGNFNLALVASLLIGAGSGIMEAVACALVSDLYPERRAFFINVTQVAFGIGAAFSPYLVQQLLIGGTNWRNLYYILAVVNLILAGALLLQPAPPRVRSEALNLRILANLLRNRAILLLCIAEMVYVGAEVSFFSWMPSYFQQYFQSGAQLAGLVVTVFWIGMSLGRIGAGSLVERMSLLRLGLTLALLSAVLSGVALLWRSPLPVMLFVGLTGLTFSSLYGLILAEAGERQPGTTGTVFGGLVAAGGVGGALFPWLVSLLAASKGWRVGLCAVPVLSLTLAALLLILLADKRRHPITVLNEV